MTEKQKEEKEKKRQQTMAQQKEEKKKIANNFSKIFSSLIEEDLREKTKMGLPYYEQNIYENMKISKGSFYAYKNGDDGKGTKANPKVPDLVALDKIKNYFNIPYAYLFNETTTKNIDNLEIGMNLGLNDDSILMLKKLYNSRNNVEREFSLYVLNCIISNKKFISNLSRVIMQQLSVKIADEKYKNLNINYENEDYMDFKKFKLSKIINYIIDDIVERDDIPVRMVEGLRKRPKHLDVTKYRFLEKELEKLEEQNIKDKKKD